MDRGEDFIVRDRLDDLVPAMNALTAENRLSVDHLLEQIEARDREITNPFSKDAQVTAIRGARSYRGDRLLRTAKPHRLLDPKAGPLIAVRLHILTRKTLGGLQTNLPARCWSSRANRCRAFTLQVKSQASAAAACMATTRWKARFSAAASIPAVSPGGMRVRSKRAESAIVVRVSGPSP